MTWTDIKWKCHNTHDLQNKTISYIHDVDGVRNGKQQGYLKSLDRLSFKIIEKPWRTSRNGSPFNQVSVHSGPKGWYRIQGLLLAGIIVTKPSRCSDEKDIKTSNANWMFDFWLMYVCEFPMSWTRTYIWDETDSQSYSTYRRSVFNHLSTSSTDSPFKTQWLCHPPDGNG